MALHRSFRQDNLDDGETLFFEELFFPLRASPDRGPASRQRYRAVVDCGIGFSRARSFIQRFIGVFWTVKCHPPRSIDSFGNYLISIRPLVAPDTCLRRTSDRRR
jgi:hypothetical protein